MTKSTEDNLSLAEAERLACLVDATSDVLKAIAKVQRHGFASVDMGQREFISNRDQLTAKIGEMHVFMQMLVDNGDIDGVAAYRYGTAKGSSVNKSLHHNKVVAEWTGWPKR